MSAGIAVSPKNEGTVNNDDLTDDREERRARIETIARLLSAERQARLDERRARLEDDSAGRDDEPAQFDPSSMTAALKDRVWGQDKAIEMVINRLAMCRAGSHPHPAATKHPARLGPEGGPGEAVGIARARELELRKLMDRAFESRYPISLLAGLSDRDLADFGEMVCGSARDAVVQDGFRFRLPGRNRKDPRHKAGLILGDIGVETFNRGNPALSIRWYREALVRIVGFGDPLNESTVKFNLGIAYRDDGKPEQAIATWEEGLALAQDHNLDLETQARLLEFLAGIHDSPEQALIALGYLNRALVLATDDSRNRLSEAVRQPVEARVRNLIGNVFRATGDLPRALEQYEMAVGMLEFVEDDLLAMEILGNLVKTSGQAGRQEEAFEYGQTARAVTDDIRVLGDPDLAEQKARTLIAVGNAFLGSGASPDGALVLREALAFETGPDLAMEGLLLLGNAWYALELRSDAVECYERVLEIDRQEQVSRRNAEARHHLGSALLELGNLRREEGDYEAAHDCYRRALPIARSRTAGSRWLEAKVLQGIGRLAFDTAGEHPPAGHRGSYDRALRHYRKALSLASSTPDLGLQAGILADLGGVYHRQGSPEKALEHYRRAEEALTTGGWTRDLPFVLSGIADVHMSLGESGDAFKAFNRAVDLADQVREGLDNSSLALTFFAPFVPIFKDFSLFLAREATDPASSVRSVAGEDPGALALAMAERARARVFLDGVLQISSEAALGDEIVEARAEEDAGLERLEKIEREIQAATNRRSRHRLAGEKQDLMGEIGAVQERIAEMMAGVRERYGLEVPAPAGLLDRIRAGLLQGPGRSRVLLEYVTGEEHSALFVLTGDHLEVLPDLPGESRLEDLVRDVTGALSLKARNWPVEGLPEAARTLYLDLIAPALALETAAGDRVILDGAELLVAADGPLARLPFATLLERDPVRAEASGEETPDSLRGLAGAEPDETTLIRKLWEEEAKYGGPMVLDQLSFLVESHPVRYLHSATADTWVEQMNGRADVSGRAVLAAAPLPQDRPDHLENAVAEVDRIGQLVRAVGLPCETDPGLTVPKARTVLGRPALLAHFACHARFDPGNPRGSHLVLEATGKAGEPFEQFTAAEIAGLRLRAELVVLSACESARGHFVEGEGPLALSRAFTAGGASSVVASLWQVPDLATRILMERYYGLLMGGEDRCVALQQAQVQMLKQPDPGLASPHAWAAFGLTGSGGPVVA